MKVGGRRGVGEWHTVLRRNNALKNQGEVTAEEKKRNNRIWEERVHGGVRKEKLSRRKEKKPGKGVKKLQWKRGARAGEKRTGRGFGKKEP